MVSSPPPLKHLTDIHKHALIVTLRDRVTPILANNLLPHFTDHSVDHSDNLTILIDNLIEPIQSITDCALNVDELVVLYASCYLHDIGMQYERADTTQPIQALRLPIPWAQLSEADRRNLLRMHHNKISAHMVTSSVHSGEPILGMQLTDDFHPSELAGLCEAHTLNVNSPEYDDLMAEHPRLRMRLLSGLLRISDILDESRRRASRLKARTLELDIEAQMHWWRHYYTEDVTTDAHESTVTVWFDFPPQHEFEYAKIVPQLQMPWVESEFANHLSVFNRYRLGWTLQRKVRSKKHSTTETMPEAVLVGMAKELNLRRSAETDSRRQQLVTLFEEVRPSIVRQLEDLEAKREGLAPDEYIRSLAALASDLTKIGSQRAGWMLLWGRFTASAVEVTPHTRLEVGLKLSSMMRDDGEVYRAFGVLQQLVVLANELPDDSIERSAFWYLYGLCAAEIGPYADVIAIMQKAEEAVHDQAQKSELQTMRAEAAFLRGDVLDALKMTEENDADQ